MANGNRSTRRDSEHSLDSLFGSPAAEEEKDLQSRPFRHAANTPSVEDAGYPTIHHETPKRTPACGMEPSVTSPAPVARMVPIGRRAVQVGPTVNVSADARRVQASLQSIPYDRRIPHQTHRTPVGHLGAAARMDTHGRGGSKDTPLIIPEISDDDEESEHSTYRRTRNSNTDGEFGSFRTSKHGSFSYPRSTRQTATRESHRQPESLHASFSHSTSLPSPLLSAMPSPSLPDNNATMGQKRPRFPSPNMEVGSAPKRVLTTNTPRPGPFLSSSSSSDEEVTKPSLPAPGKKLDIARLKQLLAHKKQVEAAAKTSPTSQADNSKPTTPNFPHVEYGNKTLAVKVTGPASSRRISNSIPSKNGLNTAQLVKKDTKPPAKSECVQRGESNFTLGHTPKANPRDARTAEASKRAPVQETNCSTAKSASRSTPKSNDTTKALQSGVNNTTATRSTPSTVRNPPPAVSPAEKRVPPWGNSQHGVPKQRTVQKPASEPQASPQSHHSPHPPAKSENPSVGVNKLSSAASLRAEQNRRLPSDNASRSTALQNARVEHTQSDKQISKNARGATLPAGLNQNLSMKTEFSAPSQRGSQLPQGSNTTALKSPNPSMAANASGRSTPHRNGSLVNSPATGGIATPKTGFQGKVQTTPNAISPVPGAPPQPNGKSKQGLQSVAGSPKPSPKPSVPTPGTERVQTPRSTAQTDVLVKSSSHYVSPQTNVKEPTQLLPPGKPPSHDSSLVAPPKSSVKAPGVIPQSGSEVHQYSTAVGQNGANGKNGGKKDTGSAATGDVPRDKIQPVQKDRSPKMTPIGNFRKRAEGFKIDTPLIKVGSAPVTNKDILNAETGKKAMQPMVPKKDASGDTIMNDAPRELLTQSPTQDRTSKPIMQVTLFAPPASAPRTDPTTITSPSVQTPKPLNTTTNTTPNAAHQSGLTSSTGTTTQLPSIKAPPIPQGQTFTYTLYQKLYTELDNPSRIPSTPLSQPYTSLAAANSQAALFVAAAKLYQEAYGVQFSSVKEFRDESDCLVFVGVGTNPAAGEEVAGRKNYCRIWVERKVVIGNVNGIESATVSKAAGGTTEYISKTLFMLRLCKIIVSDSSDSDAEDEENNEANLEYIPLSSPIIRRLDVFSEIYTVRAHANSAARRLQIGLSHKKEPLKETERKWQEKENRRLMDKIHVLEGLDTVIGSGSEGEDNEEQVGPGGTNRKCADGKDKGKGKMKKEVEIEAEKPAKRRGCWESEFNGLGGERYKLWVERVKVCGPRNM